MPGLNLTGLPNTNDYNLGRGIVFFGVIDAITGLPVNYRDLGNAPEFNVSIESETLEHQSSRLGLKSTDKEVVISQKMSLSLTLDEINFQNLAQLFSGVTATHTNPAIAGFAEILDFVAAANVVLGRWYDLKDSTGERVYDIQQTADVLLENGSAGNPGVLVDGTDYTLDLKMGRFFLLTTATNIVNGEEIDFTLTANASAVNLDEVQALTTTSVVGGLKFISENPASNDHQTEYMFHQVSLKAEGDFSLIGDEFTQMQFTAVAEKNALADATSPTLTVRTFVPQP